MLQLGQEGFLFATAQGDARVAFKDGPEGFKPAEEDFLRLAGGVDREPSALAVDHAILLRQLIQPRQPIARFLVGNEAHPQQRIVDVLGVLRRRPGLAAHALDRRGIELADGIEGLGIQRAPRHHRLRATLFQRRIVQEGVKLGIEDAPREGRWLRRVHCHPLDRPVPQAFEHFDQTFDVGCFGQTVLDRLANEWMIHRDFQIARRKVLRTCDSGGKRRRQQIARAHAKDLRRNGAAVLETLQQQRARRVPAPARFEHRLIENRLRQHLADGIRVKEVEHVGQRKAVVLAEGDDDSLFVRGGLELEAEAAAEALSQRQSPGAVDSSAEGRVQDHLHPAALVEETFEHHALLRRDAAEHLLALRDVVRDLNRGLGWESKITLE